MLLDQPAEGYDVPEEHLVSYLCTIYNMIIVKWNKLKKYICGECGNAEIKIYSIIKKYNKYHSCI